VQVAQAFPLAQAGRAHAMLDKERPAGRLVLTIA